MTRPAPVIRPATADDLGAINEIYNHYVLTSTCTYQEVPETGEARLAWFRAHGERHPVIVADRGGEVVAWASLSPFHARSAYRYSAEVSVYVRQDSHRMGLGRALIEDLISRARALGYHTLIGGASSDQAASLALQEALGFRPVAHFREVGYKFGRWLDVIYLQLML